MKCTESRNANLAVQIGLSRSLRGKKVFCNFRGRKLQALKIGDLTEIDDR